VPFFSGGYVGVDVFFVISGYLITGIIHQEHVAGGFTLLGFYERRMRRIFPALFLVVLSTFAIGAIVMIPPDLSRLGSSIVAATLFVSNFYFWERGLNYLRDAPEFEPLLHTWSLAIEEQFYLFFPIFVLLMLRFFKRLSFTFMVAALSSFAISVYLTSARPHAAFYLTPSRAWELLLGSWLAVTDFRNLIPRRIVSPLQFAGLIMIVGPTLSFDVVTPFPGFAALIPCLGTALIVAWCDQDSRLIKGLSHPTLVWLGLISYPLYLWHWPSLVLTRFALLRELHVYEIVALYVLAGVLAAATWQFVEKPFRARNGLISARRVFVLGAGVSCLALAIGGDCAPQRCGAHHPLVWPRFWRQRKTMLPCSVRATIGIGRVLNNFQIASSAPRTGWKSILLFGGTRTPGPSQSLLTPPHIAPRKRAFSSLLMTAHLCSERR
jgi:peptidoglycan/LPS O-acetylase OafA/YrhL